MAKNSWKWSGLKEDIENFPGDEFIGWPSGGLRLDPAFVRIGKERLLQLIEDAAKGDEFARVQKPKTVVEKIWEHMSMRMTLTSQEELYKMALSEAVEWMNSVLPGSDALNSILAILKAERMRDIPKR